MKLFDTRNISETVRAADNAAHRKTCIRNAYTNAMTKAKHESEQMARKSVETDKETQKVVSTTTQATTVTSIPVAGAIRSKMAAKSLGKLSAEISSYGNTLQAQTSLVNTTMGKTMYIDGQKSSISDAINNIKNVSSKTYGESLKSLQTITQRYVCQTGRVARLAGSPIRQTNSKANTSYIIKGKMGHRFSGRAKAAYTGPKNVDDLHMQYVINRQDRKTVKKLNKKLNKGTKQYQFLKKSSKIKTFNRMFKGSGRLLLMSTSGNAEATKGFNMLAAVESGVKTGGKIAVRLGEKVAYHGTRFAYRQYKFVQNLIKIKKTMEKKGEKLTFRNIKAAHKMASRHVSRRMKFKTPTNLIKNSINKLKMEQLNKLRTNSKLVDNYLAKQEKKVTKKIAKQTKKAEKHAKKVRVAKKAVKAATKATIQLVKWIAMAMKSIVSALISLLSTVIAALGVPGIIVIALVAVVVCIFAIFSDFSTSNVYSNQDYFNIYSEYVMTALEEQHTAMEKNLIKMQKEYEISDIQYPSGAKENYKEMYSATMSLIMGDYKSVTESDVKEIVDTLYDASHFIRTESYNYRDLDGTISTGEHIYLDILRDDSFLYEVYSSLEIMNESSGPQTFTLAGEADSNDWINIVKTVKACVAYTGANYSNSDTKVVDINRTKYTVTTNMTGLLNLCFKLYKPTNNLGRTVTKQDLMAATSLPGFQKHVFTSWDELRQGDVLVGESGILIYAYTIKNSNNALEGIHYVYAGGSSTELRTKAASPKSGALYAYYWRPNNPGTLDSFAIDPVEAPLNIEEAGDVFLGNETEARQFLTISNTDDVVFEKDGNEKGFATALQLTATNLINSNSEYFTSKKEGVSETFHTLTADSEGSNSASSLDFVRYICAQHGVQIGYNSYSLTELEGISYSDIQVGDIVLYCPDSSMVNNTESILKVMECKSENLSTLFMQDIAYPNSGGEDSSKDGKTYDAEAMGQLVPLICIEEGKLAAYSHDLTKKYDVKHEKDNYFMSTFEIRTYKTSELDPKRALLIKRPKGYTVNSIYGSNAFFAGWTNQQIVQYLIFLRRNCWADGTYTLPLYTGEDIIVDFSFYHEDVFKTGLYYASAERKEIFQNEIFKQCILNYDVFGLLPSVAWADASLKTYNGATIESAKYNNIFGKYYINEKNDNIAESHYSYQSNGSASSTIRYYVKYDSYYDAIADYVSDMKEVNDTILKKTSYVEQIDEMVKSIFVSSAFGEDMKKMISNATLFTGLDNLAEKADEIAIIRDQHRTSALLAKKKLAERVSEHISNFTKGTDENGDYIITLTKDGTKYICPFTKTDYDNLTTSLQNAEKEYNTLEEYLEETDSCDERIQKEVLNPLKAIIDSANKLVAAEYECSLEYPIVEKYICNKHHVNEFQCTGHEGKTVRGTSTRYYHVFLNGIATTTYKTPNRPSLDPKKTYNYIFKKDDDLYNLCTANGADLTHLKRLEVDHGEFNTFKKLEENKCDDYRIVETRLTRYFSVLK